MLIGGGERWIGVIRKHFAELEVWCGEDVDKVMEVAQRNSVELSKKKGGIKRQLPNSRHQRRKLQSENTLWSYKKLQCLSLVLL